MLETCDFGSIQFSRVGDASCSRDGGRQDLELDASCQKATAVSSRTPRFPSAFSASIDVTTPPACRNET
jgi:hypothetical protein